MKTNSMITLTMKTNSMITLTRGSKTIIIYIKDDDWGNVPKLDFIADIEVFDSKLCQVEQ